MLLSLRLPPSPSLKSTAGCLGVPLWRPLLPRAGSPCSPAWGPFLAPAAQWGRHWETVVFLADSLTRHSLVLSGS